MNTDLKITPKYDDSSVEVALVDLDELMPPPPPPEPEPAEAVELPPPVEEVVEAVVIEPPPPPKPKPPAPKPPPKPKPQVAKAAPPAKTQAVVQAPAPVPAPSPAPAAPAAPVAPAQPVTQAPRANPADLESRYIARLLAELEKYKQYPRGREASLQRPQGNVVVWLLVDRSGKVLDSGIERRRPTCCSIAPHKPACNASTKWCPSPRKVSRARTNTVSAPRLYTTWNHN
jgi:Periplasmic protein TonB, links inner and outer membranes